MKTYIVNIERNHEVISSFSVSANNLKEAKQTASFHRRHEYKGAKVGSVKLQKD